MQQTKTPLNSLFFSDFNVSLLERGIRQDFKNKTGISIDRQNRADIIALMRAEFINSSGDHYALVDSQVKDMNTRVIEKARAQLSVGVTQFINFVKDTKDVILPNELPKNTSTYGNKLPDQKFGI